MAGWHHWLDGHESQWTPGVGDGQGGLACCDSWGHKESDTTERLICPWDSLGRILEWVAFSFCKGPSQPRDRTPISCWAGGFFTTELPGKPHAGTLLWTKSQTFLRVHQFFHLCTFFHSRIQFRVSHCFWTSQAFYCEKFQILAEKKNELNIMNPYP